MTTLSFVITRSCQRPDTADSVFGHMKSRRLQLLWRVFLTQMGFQRVVGLVVLAVLLASAAASAAAAAASSEWKLTFEDEFDGEALNTSRWNVADNMTHGPEELQLYVKDEVYLEKGNLVLRTRRRDAVWNGTRL